MEEFVYAGASAVSAICIMHPVDVVKTRQQFLGEAFSARAPVSSPSSPKPSGSPSAYGGVLGSLVTIGRAEGLKGLYRGLAAACILQVSVTGVRFGTYALVKQRLGARKQGGLNHLQNMGVGLFAGILGAVCGTPFFLIKTQCQASSSVKSMQVGFQHHHSSLRFAIREVIRKEGFLGLWNGVDAFILRVAAFSAVQLSTYDFVKARLREKGGLSDGVGLHFLSSLVTGAFAVTAMQPFDLIAARLMNQPTRGAYYASPLDCALKVVRSEGPTALFKGFTANYLRMGPYNTLVFLFYEQFRRLGTQIKESAANGRSLSRNLGKQPVSQ
uniref:Mitochondrial carrier protein n=1 Tax=Chromera velia CCMP2878 TaxID=1169474 RepID=A0A0G4FWF1_9ALVE|eukprot:Cvel_19117.t1-p1 / transcript=Cvel_19117.t1 / gene=Cvel_19117 / organism=Chromera_velia_CCMP2878 / gene_product=Solute carrier family 25 member 34, putative / transcript_product=Solute carrier family 25 member 34, putative / location=Cvel_scaffold1624:12965-16912(-) / protein_length=327 / sequence_SO=supercontig / SO=protein_coding / is_pseudo=false